MKILLTNSTCGFGGTETVMLAMARGLQKQGHGVDLFFFSSGSLAQHLPAGLSARFGALPDCMRLITQKGFDVLHFNSADRQYNAMRLAEFGIPVVVTDQAIAGRPDEKNSWGKNNCDVLVCCAEWLRVWKGKALPDAEIESVPPIPSPFALAGFGLEELKVHSTDQKINRPSDSFGLGGP